MSRVPKRYIYIYIWPSVGRDPPLREGEGGVWLLWWVLVSPPPPVVVVLGSSFPSALWLWCWVLVFFPAGQDHGSRDHTYIHTYMHACIHAYMHTCIHTCIHACIHTYIHTYIHVYTLFLSKVCSIPLRKKPSRHTAVLVKEYV